jgi:hypothetical protein
VDASIDAGGSAAEVLGNGFIQVAEWKQAGSNSVQGFVAMWFDPSMDDA